MHDHRPESNEYPYEVEPKFKDPNEDLDFKSRVTDYKNDQKRFRIIDKNGKEKVFHPRATKFRTNLNSDFIRN